MIVGLYAVGPDGEFGLEGKLPWDSFPEELTAFKNILQSNKGGCIIVGMNTWNGLPTSIKELLESLNYKILMYCNRKTAEVLDLVSEGYFIINKFDYSLKEYLTDVTALVIGGAQTLVDAMDAGIMDGLYISRVWNNEALPFAADTYLPEQLYLEDSMPPASVFLSATGKNEKLTYVQEYHYFGSV